MERFKEKGKKVYDNYYEEYLCEITDNETRKATINRLNELEDKINNAVDLGVDLQHKLSEVTDKYENILKLIDIKIQENRQLAYLHYPRPEDDYVNEYDSRAKELEQLKELIMNGK